MPTFDQMGYNWSQSTTTTPLVTLEVFPTILERLRGILMDAVQQKPKILGAYLLIVSTQRWYTSHNESSMTRLWDQIRQEPPLTDFVIETARELALKCGSLLDRDTSFENYLAEELADSLDMFASEKSVIDTDVLQQVSPENCEDLLKGNIWFMVMEMASMCGIVEAVRAYTESLPPTRATTTSATAEKT